MGERLPRWRLRSKAEINHEHTRYKGEGEGCKLGRRRLLRCMYSSVFRKVIFANTPHSELLAHTILSGGAGTALQTDCLLMAQESLSMKRTTSTMPING